MGDGKYYSVYVINKLHTRKRETHGHTQRKSLWNIYIRTDLNALITGNKNKKSYENFFRFLFFFKFWFVVDFLGVQNTLANITKFSSTLWI